jgi:ABC-type Fe3+-siderophore transport system permease subunit
MAIRSIYYSYLQCAAVLAAFDLSLWVCSVVLLFLWSRSGDATVLKLLLFSLAMGMLFAFMSVAFFIIGRPSAKTR